MEHQQGSDMKNWWFRLAAPVMVASAVVAGCGGNPESSGASTPFNVVPDAITLTGPDANTCGFGLFNQLVFVYGGAGPYKIDNTLPDFIVLNPPRLDKSGQSFQITVLGGACLTDIPIVITDQTGKQVTLTITTKRGGATP
jgi:hypothetical protein